MDDSDLALRLKCTRKVIGRTLADDAARSAANASARAGHEFAIQRSAKKKTQRITDGCPRISVTKSQRMIGTEGTRIDQPTDRR